MHALLLKEPRDGESGPDPYVQVEALSLNPHVFNSTVFIYMFWALTLLMLFISVQILTGIYYFVFQQELASHGHKATLIPVLSFKFVSLNTLSDKVNPIVTVLN